MILEIIGKNIKDFRKKQKMAQIDLAVKVDVDRSYLSGIENGKKNFSILLMSAIATALDCEIEDLLKEK